MQQSLSEPTSYPEYSARRRNRPVMMKRAQWVFIIALVVIDLGCTWLAYYAGLLAARPQSGCDHRSLPEFWPLPALQSAFLLGIFFVRRMYQRRRPIGHLDEFFKIIVFNTLAMLFTVATLALAAPDFEYHRTMLLYAWAAQHPLL